MRRSDYTRFVLIAMVALGVATWTARHEKKAVSLAERTSEGEKLFILAKEAGTNGDVTKQKECVGRTLLSA